MFTLFSHNNRLNFQVRDKFPHIKDYKAFKVPEALDLNSILKDQLAVALFDCKYVCINIIPHEIFSYCGFVTWNA